MFTVVLNFSLPVYHVAIYIYIYICSSRKLDYMGILSRGDDTLFLNMEKAQECIIRPSPPQKIYEHNAKQLLHAFVVVPEFNCSACK